MTMTMRTIAATLPAALTLCSLLPARSCNAQDQWRLPEKIVVRYARVEDIMDALGAATIPPHPSAGGGVARNLLPDGIMDIVGLAVDNTVIARGSDEGMRELRLVVALFDVPAPQVAIRGEATVTTELNGSIKRTIRMAFDGRTNNRQPMFVKVVRVNSGPGLPGKSGSVSCKGRIEAQVQNDGEIQVHCQWDLDVLAASRRKNRPTRLRKEWIGGSTLSNGGTARLFDSESRIDEGTVRFTVRITPRLLPPKPLKR